MITAAEVDTLLFDVLGTVVDETGSMRAALAAALQHADMTPEQRDELGTAWATRASDLVKPIRQGAPWRPADELAVAALSDVLRDGPDLPAATVGQLAQVSHRLRPWPDSVLALRTLAERFTVVALSDGNLSMLTDTFAAAGLTWHCVLSGELVRAYKPDPSVYRFALERLALNPRRTLMVAAHPFDLRAAATFGLRTAYIERAGVSAPEPSDTFDLAMNGLAELAEHLVGSRSVGL